MKIVTSLPHDWRQALLVGRILGADGPTPVLARAGRLFDISAAAPTTAQALALPDLADVDGVDLGDLETLEFTTAWSDDSGMELLSPLDLQCIKASGVTFAVSALERVIEERARGDAEAAIAIRS